MITTHLNDKTMEYLGTFKTKSEIDKVYTLLDLLEIARRKKKGNPDINELELLYAGSDLPYPLMKEIVQLETPRQLQELGTKLDSIREKLPPFDLFQRDGTDGVNWK